MTNPNSTEGEEATRKIRSLAEFCAEGKRLGLTAFDIVDALRKRPEFADCLPGAPGETGDTSGVPASAAPSISDEQILHLWDACVGYETARRSAQKMPLSKDDKLQFARAVLEAASGVRVPILTEAMIDAAIAAGPLENSEMVRITMRRALAAAHGVKEDAK